MTKDEEIAELKTAFKAFSESSDVLAKSYLDLQQEVVRLYEQLEKSEQDKRQEQDKNRILVLQFQQLFESMPVGVLLLNEEGLVVMANPVADRLFNLPLVGQSWGSIVPLSFRPQEDDGHDVSMASGRRVRVETASLGNVPGQLVILVDLTEAYLLQKKLSHHERLSNMGKMVAALAHQIRTPLSSATLYAGHLQKPDLAPVMRQTFANKLVDRLANIEKQIRDMLIFSRSEIKLDETVGVSAFIKELTNHCQEICDQKNMQLEVSGASFLATDCIQCNKETLLGALLNLLNNAVDAQSAGDAVQLDWRNNDGYVTLTFKDRGVGMSKAHLEHVQEGFVTTKQHGTGLGLMVVKAIARAHHGQFEIDSIEGAGTTASLTLPLVRV
ncbi:MULTISPECIES: sensor histidine kinase [Marinomonas]|uniref:sensor histidine kinase n=1 Tax=Marinomonas TaxID=28253 RepID=UPI000C1ECBAB|nr:MULTISPECIES: ATP-binding protein [unclassified Marinomonas]MBU1294992.1 PAS domain-containing protein [Gammaproteobacteria bacterium]MBU1465593.1 PAS domain-containing protein [Gammaproteobacteria bacterium]MBU2020876.1 PAS domain-containing protein [Gammaproteobacteria bacterium]MBU2413081.1 PAS domain-containing protein [Gammaproteobacteria bacterium]PJE55237.1 histidine kinase [Marinomonas sp. BSi20584]